MNPSPIAQEYVEKGYSESCPIIDMHGHVGPFYGCFLPSSSPERMRHRMQRAGVRRIVCSHHSALACDVEWGNRQMQELVTSCPESFLGYWVINPNQPDIIEKDLDGFRRLSGFVGLKFWPDYHLVPVTSPKYAAALRYADEHGLLVLVHTFGESPFDAPALLALVAEKYPRARFLMGHSGYGEWETSVAAARDLPNLYLDLTSVVQALDFSQMPGGSLMPRVPLITPHVNGLIEYMVNTAGSSKIVFGSDLPWYSQHYHAGAILFARVSDDERHDIFHRNAEKLLGTHLERAAAPASTTTVGGRAAGIAPISGEGADDAMSHTSDRLKVALIDLDGKPLADWVPKRLAEEGISLHVHQCDTRDDLAQHAGAAEVVWLFGGKPILKGNLDVIPRCWAVIRTGSGTDNVPVAEATQRGIIVANTPAAFTDGVSDHTIALLFAVLRRVVTLDQAVRRGAWDHVAKEPLNAVTGRTLGLVGFGLIPRELVRKLSGFGLKVLAFDPFVPRDVMAKLGVDAVDLDALLAHADFVSLHCPLTEQTRHLIGERQLRSMKPGAILLNTARGAVVDESALVRVLSEGRLAGAGLDVFEREPPAPDNPLFQLDNVVVTAHAAGVGADGLEARWRLSVETVLAFANRQWPASCVNPNVQPRHQLTRPKRQD